MNRKTKRYAKQIFEMSRDALVMKHHFLSYAFYALEAKGLHDTELDGFHYATEGIHFYYDENRLIEDFMSDKVDTSHIFLHSILHCLYLHPYFASQYKDQELWDMACDLFIWDIMDHLELQDDMRIRNMLKQAKESDMIISAQSLYSRLREMRLKGFISSDEIDQMRLLLKVDDHVLWYMPSGQKGGNQTTSENQSGQDGQALLSYVAGNFTSTMKKWQNAADRATVGLESAMRGGKYRGRDPGHLIESLQGIQREQISYDDFLRKFAAVEERMMIDIDAFDYNYYTYGLNLYGDLPLVEPVEFKEMHTIREFVIAIDSSGSINTETLKKFLTKTYNILQESIFAEDSLDVRIIQCDARVQDVRAIHSKTEMEEYIRQLKAFGRGGTDFRPVFEKIEKYRNGGELKNLRGLIYFTDGYGTYPSQPANYKTAFVFSEDYDDSQVPSWILKYQLKEEFS